MYRLSLVLLLLSFSFSPPGSEKSSDLLYIWGLETQTCCHSQKYHRIVKKERGNENEPWLSIHEICYMRYEGSKSHNNEHDCSSLPFSKQKTAFCLPSPSSDSSNSIFYPPLKQFVMLLAHPSSSSSAHCHICAASTTEGRKRNLLLT